VTRATKETLAGRRYLDLQREGKRTDRPTDELIQLYALECFLDRLVHSEFAEKFVLEAGVLLAPLEALVNRRKPRCMTFDSLLAEMQDRLEFIEAFVAGELI
jgi:hypothetical protein